MKKDEIREYQKRYYEKHKDEIKEYQKQYRILNKENLKKYRNEHIEKYKEYYKNNYVPVEKVRKGVCPINEGETWKEIDVEGWYLISNKGRVWSYRSGHILRQSICKVGYYVVVLRINNKKTTKYVHRLVADAFLENKNNFSTINHKDCCKTNNNVENLEWCTQSYNVTYSNAQDLRLKSRGGNYKRRGKCVLKYDLNGNLINEYNSASEAERDLNVKNARVGIIRCCKGKRKTAYRYVWKYK